MSESPSTQDKGQASGGAMESRLDELEIKLAFMEKELEEYKEASRGFYNKINVLEEELRKLRKESTNPATPVPEVAWDRENREVRP